ncbi:MAG TPA: tetratricopeptide repeat protein [Bacteroidota bacterium]
MRPTTTYGTLLVLGLAIVAGCSGTKNVPAPPKAAPQQHTALDEMRRDQAMKHFIDGALYDSKEDYARAILEYQEALKIDNNPAIHYAISKDYSALGKHANAADHARQAVKLDSANITYRENLGDIYMNAYQPELAAREYEAIVRLDSTLTDGWYNLARIYQASKPLRALEIIERLLEREGDNWDLLLQAAELNRTLGRYDRAAEDYARMLELDPGNKPLRRQLAETYGRAGKFDEAVKILESMMEADENDPEVVATLADLYLDRNDFQKAIDLYEKLLQRGRKNPEVKLRVGIAYYGMIPRDSTFLAKAKVIFEEVTKELPNDGRAYLHLGSLALMEKRDSAAAVFFERATTLSEWNADAWVFLGNIYFERGQYEKVIETMERAQKAVPKDYRVYLLAGYSYSQLGQTAKVIIALEKALGLNPNDVNALGTLALTYDGLDQFQKSDSLYERALALDPNSHLVLNNYGYSLSERGIQLDRALGMAQRAVAAEPKNASYLDTLGWVFYKLKNFQEAARYIGDAIATGQASSAVHEHMGDIYFQLGDKTKAMEFWQKALDMNRTNQALKEKVQRGSL